MKLLLLFLGIIFAHYDSKFRNHHQLCLTILKRMGFGQRVMETRILMEVEEMIRKVRDEQGRPFDVRQLTTSCVANVFLNMIFGYRFDHDDPAFQQLISDTHEGTSKFSLALMVFPALRFLPYFKKLIATFVKTNQNASSFVNDNTAKCVEVCNFF